MCTKSAIFVLVMGGFIAFVALRPSVNPTLDVDGYFIPLTGGYGIWAYWHDPSQPPRGTYLGSQEKSASMTSGPSVDCKEIDAATKPAVDVTARLAVADIRQVAVVGRFIVGTSGKEFFIFDTTPVDSYEPRCALMYSDRASWTHAMADAGIRAVPDLVDPVLLTKGVPDTIIHPDHYRIMNGIFGWSDDAWAENIFFLCFVAMFLQGLLATKRRISLPALVLGIVGAFVIDEVLGDGGPQLVGGLFSLPIEFLVVGYIARMIRWAALKLPQRHAIASGIELNMKEPVS